MRTLWIAAAACAALPTAASACAVCFGQADGTGWGRGFLWGLVILLGATFAILGVLAATVARIERMKEESDRRSSSPAA